MKKIFTILVFCAGVFLFAHILIRAVWQAPADEVEAFTEDGADAVPMSTPVTLEVPTLGIDAAVVPVGITTKGNMATPKRFVDIGWYKYGALPGAYGSAVFAGHLNNGLALPAVFAHLSDIAIGDAVVVHLADGQVLHFTVTDIATYDFTASAEDIFSDDSERSIRLITCTGNWIPQLRTHDERLVVTAVLDTDAE